MNELKIDENYLDVTKSALDKSKKENLPVIALKVNKKIIGIDPSEDMLNEAKKKDMTSLQILP